MAREPNPFRYLRPVPPKEFLGRWSLVEEIARDLTYHSGDSYACIGGRRFGKSSLLLALHHNLRQAGPTDSGHLVLPLLIDFKRTFSSENDFWEYVLEEIRSRTDVKARRRVPDPSPVKVPLDQAWLDSLVDEDRPGLPFTQFEQGLDYILDRLEKADGPTRLILLLDEVDDVLDEEWHRTLFKQLRSLLSIGGSTDIVRLVLSGSRRFLDAVSDRGSPLWNILQLRYLHVFDEPATYELMDRAPGLPKAARQAVWQQSGGHPFLAQYLLHHLWKEGLSQTSESSVSRLVNRFLHEEEVHLTGWANAVEEIGLSIYRCFTGQARWLSEDYLIWRADAPADRIKRALVALCYHGLIEHDGTWNCYRRTSDLFRHWFLSTHPTRSTEGENDMIPSPPVIDPTHVPDDGAQLTHTDILLVTVSTVEARAVLDVVKERYGLLCKPVHIGNNTYRDLGDIGGARTLMVRSGMGSGGTRGAILTVTDGINDLRPSAVVMVGIAFGVDPNKQRIGDILVSRQILAYELQRVSTGDEEKAVIIPRGDRPSASARLLARFEDGELYWSETEIRFGLVLSGDKLVDNVDFREQLRKLEPEAIGGEMEGAGLYASAVRHHVDWILVKAICDWADGKKHENKKQRQATAAQNAARFAIYVIEQGGFGGGGSSLHSIGNKEAQSARAGHDVVPSPSEEYNLAAIRKLLLAAFTPQTLRRFCQERPIFRPIENEFSPAQGLSDMVDHVIDYCDTYLLFGELLAAVKKANSRQYGRFAPYLQSAVEGADGSEDRLMETA